MSNVLVTGGSRGVGLGICEAFLEKGHNVVFTCRSTDNLTRALERLSVVSNKNIVRGIICDSGVYLDVQNAVRDTLNILDNIDILVNNAGVRKYGSIYDVSIEDWIDAVNTNINGYFYFCKLFIPYLEKSENAWIFNIGSTAAHAPFAGGVSYNTTKAAVHAFSSSIELDVRKKGIRVCTVSPGNVFNKDYPCPQEDTWMMNPIDIGHCIISLLNYDRNITPSIIEVKPTNSPEHPEKGIRALRYL